MDNFRLILIVALFFILFMLYQAWQQDYGPKPPNTATPTDSMGEPSTSSQFSKSDSSDDAELPTPKPESQASPIGVPTASAEQLLPSESRILVETDVLRLTIDTKGGDVRRVELLDYPVKVETPEKPFQLMNDQLPNVFIAQSGLLPKESAPTHQAVYQAGAIALSIV
jgi:YidC/Oxa1 family membrane protein insertase